ncbi:MAG: hypothetical protein AB2807_04390 [Candidatus Sedimenticola endophacoides]
MAEQIEKGERHRFVPYVDSARPDLSQTVVGEYDLSPTLLRIAGAIEQCGAGVLKLRGSSHGSNNYPFSLTGSGVSLLPITSTRLDNQASIRRASTGVARIDEMLGGEGYLLGLSPRAVENHRARIFAKLNLSGLGQLIGRATALRLLRATGAIR